MNGSLYWFVKSVEGLIGVTHSQNGSTLFSAKNSFLSEYKINGIKYYYSTEVRGHTESLIALSVM